MIVNYLHIFTRVNNSVNWYQSIHSLITNTTPEHYRYFGSVLFYVPEGRKIVLGKDNCPRTEIQCVLTLFSVLEGQTIENYTIFRT